MMSILDPLSAGGSSISATIKILEVTYQLKAVDEQTRDLLTTTSHVDSMVQEARRLRRLKASLLNISESAMIDKVISDTEDALRAVAKLVEPCRVDVATKNSIRLGHRIMWVYRDNPSVRDKHQKLQLCYQSLTVVFACLYAKDAVVIAPAPERGVEEQPPPYDPQVKELLDWHNRRKGRKSVGEATGPTSENTGLTKGNSNDILVADPSRPYLQAIPLEENDAVPSLPASSSEVSFESPSLPRSETKPSIPHDNDKLLSSATTPPELKTPSSLISPNDSFPYDETQITPPPTHMTVGLTNISPIYSLPEIDTLAFSSMLANYTFSDDQDDVLQASATLLTHESLSALDQKLSSSVVTASVTPSDSTLSSALPFSPAAVRTPSSFSEGCDVGSKPLESSRRDRCGHPGCEEAPPSPAQHPLPARLNSDITNYQSDRLDALARAEEVVARENRAVSVGGGTVERGGRRSWLAYHATRGESSTVRTGSVDHSRRSKILRCGDV